jgi:hypothetical protein
MASDKDPLSRAEVADLLEKFLDGTGGRWDYDDFTQGMKFQDPLIQEIQSESADISKNYPPEKRTGFSNEEGLKVLRGFVDRLRSSEPSVY